MKGDFRSLCTVTFCQKVDFLISNMRLYGSEFKGKSPWNKSFGPSKSGFKMYKPLVNYRKHYQSIDQYEVSLQLSKDSFIGHPIQFFHCYLIMIVFINYKLPFQDFSCCASASWVVHSLNSQLIAQHANLSLISRINLSGSAPYPSLVGSAVYHNLWFHESFLHLYIY